MQETEKMRVWSPESGRPAGGGHGNSLQYSCLENPHGQRSLAGYSPQGHTEWDLTLDNGNVQPMLRAAVVLNNVDTPETNNTLKKQVSRNSGLWPVNPEDWPDKLTRQMLPAIKLMCSWVCMWEHMGAHTHTHIHTHTHTLLPAPVCYDFQQRQVFLPLSLLRKFAVYTHLIPSTWCFRRLIPQEKRQ